MPVFSQASDARVSGPAQRRLEADAAVARKEAAQSEARYKTERAQWMAEVDMGKMEVRFLGTPAQTLTACFSTPSQKGWIAAGCGAARPTLSPHLRVRRSACTAPPCFSTAPGMTCDCNE
jgi:hypothetical protein